MKVNFDAFTVEAQKVAQEVISIAACHNQSHLDIEHVMLALLSIHDPELDTVLDRLEIDKELVKQEFKYVVARLPKAEKSTVKNQQFTIDERMKQVIEQAQHEANRLWVKDIKPVHLLLAAIQMYLGPETSSAGGKIVKNIGITPEKIRRIIF